MLKAGVARIDITPPAGEIIACFPRKREPGSTEDAFVPGRPDRIPRRAKGAHDPLQARVVVLVSAGETVALCVADVAHFHGTDVEFVRRAVAEKAPELGGGRVILSATHTHSGPDTLYLFGKRPGDPQIRGMLRRVAAGIVQASRDLEPVTAFRGRAQLELTHNRRVREGRGSARMALEHVQGVTTGPVDEELNVLRLDAARGPKAVLFNYTAHALTLGPGNDLYTADYPGEACRLVEEAFPGVLAAFTNGAAGDVHPRQCMRGEFGAMEEMGGRLAAGVVQAARQAAAMPIDSFHWRRQLLAFAHRTDPSRQVRPEIHALLLGPAAVGFVPGEFFVEHQLRLKQALHPRPVWLVGYTGGWVGYVPTRQEHEAGGYGVDPDRADPPDRSRTSLPPGAGEEIVDRLLALFANNARSAPAPERER